MHLKMMCSCSDAGPLNRFLGKVVRRNTGRTAAVVQRTQRSLAWRRLDLLFILAARGIGVAFALESCCDDGMGFF